MWEIEKPKEMIEGVGGWKKKRRVGLTRPNLFSETLLVFLERLLDLKQPNPKTKPTQTQFL